MVIPAEIAAVREATANIDLIEKHWNTSVHLAASVMSDNGSALLHWPDSGPKQKKNRSMRSAFSWAGYCERPSWPTTS